MKTKRLLYFLLVSISFILSGFLAWELDGKWFSFSHLLESVFNSVGDTSRQQKSASEELPIIKPSQAPTTELIGEHGREFACKSFMASGIRELPPKKIFRWFDNEKNVHYSDSVPDGFEYEIVDVGSKQKDYFELAVHTPSGSVPVSKDKLRIYGEAIYKVYSNFLGLENMSKSKIDVLVYVNNGAYQSYRNQVAPDISANIHGFYSWALNQAVVLHSGDNRLTERVAVHETTHVINARNFGVMPKWFNEGMAELFENIEVSDMKIMIKPDQGWLRSLGRSYPVFSVQKLLSSTSEDWAGENSNAFYANSWAFAYFLMKGSNRRFTKGLQLELAKDKCSEVDTATYIQRHYPGGIKGIQRNWHNWLSQTRKHSENESLLF